ncbi:MAG: hypothetical protein ACLFNU_08420 [Bacteroidales bacterium]
MDRASIINRVINVFNKKQKQAEYIISAESIIPEAGIMIEEFFEAKFNPFLRELKREILELPLDDYSIIEIDTWIKSLSQNLDDIENGDIVKEFAELVYIKRKYIPKLIRHLKDIKLELIEKLFDINSGNIETSKESVIFDRELSGLSAGSTAELIAQLCNFNVITGDIGSEELADIFTSLTGCTASEIKNKLTYNGESHRYASNSSLEELIALRKVIKSIAARLDNDIRTRRNNEDM